MGDTDTFNFTKQLSKSAEQSAAAGEDDSPRACRKVHRAMASISTRSSMNEPSGSMA